MLLQYAVVAAVPLNMLEYWKQLHVDSQCLPIHQLEPDRNSEDEQVLHPPRRKEGSQSDRAQVLGYWHCCNAAVEMVG